MSGARSPCARLVSAIHKVLVDEQFKLAGVGDAGSDKAAGGDCTKLQVCLEIPSRSPICLWDVDAIGVGDAGDEEAAGGDGTKLPVCWGFDLKPNFPCAWERGLGMEAGIGGFLDPTLTSWAAEPSIRNLG